MDGQLISIVIPVYNAEKYLDECLESVVKQTFQNLEIILVDDGSVDESLNICFNWEKKDLRIKVIRQPNRGVSSARNKGLSIAKGKYVLFIDADDLVSRDYVEKLSKKTNIADIVLCGYMRFGQEEREVLLGKSGFISREELFFTIICNNVLHGACWNKIFRTDILNEKQMRFDENLAIGEDMAFLVRYLQYCNSYYYINEPLYLYRKNEQSAMQRNYSNKKFNDKIVTCLDSVKHIDEFTIEENQSIRKYVSYRIMRSSIWLILQMILGNNKDKEVFTRIKKNCRKNYLKCRNVKAGTLLERIVGLFLCISPLIVFKCGTFAINNMHFSLDNYLE